jgi:hypothetical protein
MSSFSFSMYSDFTNGFYLLAARHCWRHVAN